MTIKPLADHILIEPLKQEEKTESGILLPGNTEKDRPEQGRVISVGPGKAGKDGKRAEMDVKEGDTVLFTKYAPTEITVDHVEYLIAKAEDILAVIKE